jgi:lipopolysaccharide/colanic/teichoic acid biosynthesis glycosyltransferase
MADRTPAITTTTSDVALGALVPFPSQRSSPPLTSVEAEIESIAAGLESLVDARAETFRRFLDVSLAAAALAVLSPVMLIVAAGIKIDSRGPVFYAQDRVGINRRRGERRIGSRLGAGRRRVINAGRPFVIYKFRTMRTDAEAAGPQWATNGDPRITRFGALLRKTRLDEVPQFINVLRGDMTLIGPRPERPFFVNLLQDEVPHYSKRLLVKPGITGLAQVNNGYDDSVESVRKKVRWDLHYIHGRSLRSDLSIVLKTIRTVLTGEGAC